jgi:signal transduction histidine kinase
VVVNLLDNAVKYTPAGGSISLKVAASGGRAVLEVADSGIGISAEALPHIFERFYRADRSRSRETEGAGLGLAIVKSICNAHGGELQVESAPGRGSRLRVKFPYHER